MLVALKDITVVYINYYCLFTILLLSFIFILGIEITYKLDEKINGFMQLHPTGS
jgi:hypothetical protein